MLGSNGKGVLAIGVFMMMVVEILGGCWCEQRFRSVVSRLLVAVSLFLPFVFCIGPVFPCVSVSWSFGGLGFYVVYVLLVLLRVALGLVFDGSFGLMISVVRSLGCVFKSFMGVILHR